MNQIHDLIQELVDVARKGLPEYFEPGTGLFGNIISDAGVGPEKPHLLLTHSLISLLGIAEHKPFVSINYERAVDAVFDKVPEQGGIRELSLLLWLLAKGKDPRAEKIFSLIDRVPEKVLQQAETMEVAWFLTALVFELKRKESQQVRHKFNEILDALGSRFIRSTGLFLHRDRQGSRDLRYGIANFADQIYSIYALSQCYPLIKETRCLGMAEQCAMKITALQGPQGQWWWHYDALRGNVFQGYPVFSVHQDAMAPFALMSLNAVSHHDHSPHISSGLRWMLPHNELDAAMINKDLHYVRRGIERRPFFSKACKLATLVFCVTSLKFFSRRYDHPEYLRTMDWEHSYHLGWILYAFSEENEHLWRRLQ